MLSLYFFLSSPPSATDAGSAHLTVACVQAPVGEAPAAGLPLGVSFPWDPSGLSLGHCPWPFPSFRSCPERTVCQFVFMERNRSLTGHFFLPGSRPQSTGDRLRGLPVGLHEVEVRLREVLQHCVTSGSPTYCRVLRRLFLPMACFLPRIHLKVSCRPHSPCTPNSSLHISQNKPSVRSLRIGHLLFKH